MEEWLIRAGCILLGVAGVAAIGYSFWQEDFEGFRSEIRYRRAVRVREPLDAIEFFARFYATSGVNKALVDSLRELVAEFCDVRADLIRPEDNYTLICRGGDATDFIAALEDRFGIVISDAECESVDGSFDSLVRFLADKQLEAAKAAVSDRGGA